MSSTSAASRRRSRRNETPSREISPTQDDEHVDVVYQNPVRVPAAFLVSVIAEIWRGYAIEGQKQA